MFDIQTQLFEDQEVCLGPIDHEKDPEIESQWTHDSDEKAGFRHEGRKRQLLSREGKRWDELSMGILREEWMELNNQAPASGTAAGAQTGRMKDHEHQL